MRDNFCRRVWVEIDLDAIASNYYTLRSLVLPSTKVCCVIKANAYGHGAVQVARRLEREGADFFAVSNVKEALELRDGGIRADILILGYTPPEFARVISEKDISQCVYSESYAHLLAQEAKSAGVYLRVHLKVDVGMGRLGFVFSHSEDESLSELARVAANDRFVAEGIFTHFPRADAGEAGREETHLQYERFTRLIKRLEEVGICFSIRHCANSAAILEYPEFALDMVRAGISLYGEMPSAQVTPSSALRPAFTLKSIISNIKEVCAGDRIGYGGEFIAECNRIVATLPVGYGDGFLRSYAVNGSKVYLNGKACRILGGVCMDQLMIDISDAGSVFVGDEAVIFGREGTISLAEFAKINKTIPYEILTGVTSRVERIYIQK